MSAPNLSSSSRSEKHRSRHRRSRTSHEIRSSMTEANSSTSKLWLNGKYSDLTIKCQNQTFMAHRVILTSRCNFFEILCGRGFQESETQTVNLDDDDPEALEAFLKYLYTYETSEIDQRGISHESIEPGYFVFLLKTFMLANKYDQPLLEEHISRLITWHRKCDECQKAGGKVVEGCVRFYGTDRTNFQSEIFKALPLALEVNSIGDYGHYVYNSMMHMAAELLARLENDHAPVDSNVRFQEINDALVSHPEICVKLMIELGIRLKDAREKTKLCQQENRELKKNQEKHRPKWSH